MSTGMPGGSLRCKKICLKITVPVLKVFMHKQSLKIRTHLCWEFEVRVLENKSHP